MKIDINDVMKEYDKVGRAQNTQYQNMPQKLEVKKLRSGSGQ
jgi:hypothetical protein